MTATIDSLPPVTQQALDIFTGEQAGLVSHAFDRGGQPAVQQASDNVLAPIRLTAQQQAAISEELQKAMNLFGPAPFEEVFSCNWEDCKFIGPSGFRHTPRIRDHWNHKFNHVNRTMPGAAEFKNLFLLMAVNWDNNLVEDLTLSDEEAGNRMFMFRAHRLHTGEIVCKFRQDDLIKILDFHNQKYRNHRTIPTFPRVDDGGNRERRLGILDLISALEEAPGFVPSRPRSHSGPEQDNILPASFRPAGIGLDSGAAVVTTMQNGKKQHTVFVPQRNI